MNRGLTGKELYALKARGTGLDQEELLLVIRTYEWVVARMRKYMSSGTKAEERLKKAAVHIAVASDLISPSNVPRYVVLTEKDEVVE